MGDMLAFDAERLKIIVERHLLHTGSDRARELLDNWDVALTHFVKVMPTDYRRALLELERFLHAKPQSRRQRLYGVAQPEMPDSYADPVVPEAK